MGAVRRGWQAERLLKKLPSNLNVPIVRVLFEAYESDTFERVLPAVTAEVLLPLQQFFVEEKTRQEQTAVTSTSRGAEEDELEMLVDVTDYINCELYVMKGNEGDWPTPTDIRRQRVIDGAELRLS